MATTRKFTGGQHQLEAGVLFSCSCHIFTTATTPFLVCTSSTWPRATRRTVLSSELPRFSYRKNMPNYPYQPVFLEANRGGRCGAASDTITSHVIVLTSGVTCHPTRPRPGYIFVVFDAVLAITHGTLDRPPAHARLPTALCLFGAYKAKARVRVVVAVRAFSLTDPDAAPGGQRFLRNTRLRPRDFI